MRWRQPSSRFVELTKHHINGVGCCIDLLSNCITKKWHSSRHGAKEVGDKMGAKKWDLLRDGVKEVKDEIGQPMSRFAELTKHRRDLLSNCVTKMWHLSRHGVKEVGD